jgi:hypothetical protein
MGFNYQKPDAGRCPSSSTITNPATMKLLIITLFVHWTSIAIALTVQGSIPPSRVLSNPSVLPADTQITLTTAGTRKSTFLRNDNTFVFRNVSQGSYLLETTCTTYHFAPLRVDVDRSGTVKAFQTFRGNAWSNLGEMRTYPIVCSSSLVYISVSGVCGGLIFF